MRALPDDAIVCRGGSCTAARFTAGTGVTVRPDGALDGISVNSLAGVTLSELARSIPNRQVGATTVGAIRALGGEVTPAPNSRNRRHCVMNGLTAKQAETLFTPTVLNPNAD